MPPSDDRILVYSAGRDVAYVSASTIVGALAALVAALAFAPDKAALQREFGPAVATAWRAGIPTAAAGLVGLWAWWLRGCVRRIHWLPGEQVALVETYGLMRWRRLRLDPRTITGVAARAGRFATTLGPEANAPHRRIRRARARDLVLDDQGQVVDAARLAAILAGRLPE